MASSPPCSAFGIRGLFNRQIFLGELDFSVAGFVLLDFLLNERFDHIGHGTAIGLSLRVNCVLMTAIMIPPIGIMIPL